MAVRVCAHTCELSNFPYEKLSCYSQRISKRKSNQHFRALCYHYQHPCEEVCAAYNIISQLFSLRCCSKLYLVAFGRTLARKAGKRSGSLYSENCPCLLLVPSALTWGCTNDKSSSSNTNACFLPNYLLHWSCKDERESLLWENEYEMATCKLGFVRVCNTVEIGWLAAYS
jgi:hypothetical protein